MNINNPVKFNTPEFQKVFQKIKEKENKDGYYCVRQSNKFHAAQFEERIDFAKVDIQNLRSLAISKFSDQIQFLYVRIPGDLSNLSELRFASVAFFPNVQKVNVIFTEGRSAQKYISISQAIIFRGLTVVLENYNRYIEIKCQNQDVQIIDSKFDGIGLRCDEANQLTVKNSSFSNVQGWYGLYFSETKNTTKIDNVQFFNCSTGLQIGFCGTSNVFLNKIYAEKCQYGCRFDWVFGELKLNQAEIVDCETGMKFISVYNSIVQNVNIIGALKKGIWLYPSTVQYRQIFINESSGVEGRFRKIISNQSTFTEIL